jgi:hypothetical protein
MKRRAMGESPRIGAWGLLEEDDDRQPRENMRHSVQREVFSHGLGIVEIRL